MPIARHALAIGALLTLAGAPGVARAAVPADGDGQVEFITPTGNIGCTYTPKGGTPTYEPTGGGPELSCSRIAPRYVTVIMGPSGRVQRIDDPGEQGCCGDVTRLGYGQRWARGPFACSSTTAGLICSGPGRHGFSLSRSRIAVR